MKEARNNLTADGRKKTMYTSDYASDALGQLSLGIMSNIVGQLSYFYTDKVGIAVGSVGIIMAIAKIIDAFTDVVFGNILDHAKGGNQKYYKWMAMMCVPAAAIVFLLFTVPIQAGQLPAVIYALVTNVLLSAIFYTVIATPFAAIQIVRTDSQNERSKIGIFRAIANYGSGMLVVIATVPLTNALGGTQSAWIKYGAILGLAVLLGFVVCYLNGRKALFTGNETELKREEDALPFKDAIGKLFRNKYWVIALLFNLLTTVIFGIISTSITYYTKWIFGNDNLTALLGGLGFAGTIVGFALSNKIINKLGVRGTVNLGVLGAAASAAVRCIMPDNLIMYAATSMVGSMLQIPLMCLYGVILGMAVDYNEYKYGNRIVATASGAVGFGNKVGSGVGTAIMSLFLAIGAYDATLEVATESMKMSIYGFSNYLPIVINMALFFVFRGFDIEEKLPQMKKEIAARRTSSSGNE